MPKKLIIYSLEIIILFVIGFFIYRNLPIEITRKTDIAIGNNIIKNIEAYKLEHNKLPNQNDLKNLLKLGFQIKDLGTKPDYTIDSKGNYKIAFTEGFDGPYLIWNSIDKKWKSDFATIISTSLETELSINKEKRILFIRPSEEKFESLKDEEGIYEVDSDFGFAIQQTMDSLRSHSKYKDLKFKVITDRFIVIENYKNCPKTIDTDTLLYSTILIAPEKEIQIINVIHSMGYLSVIDQFYEIK